MSIKKGNEFWKKGELDKAIEEYKKISKDSSLYKIAQQNINFIMNKKMPEKLDISLESHIIDDIEPLVSVIIPVYNVEKYLDASILSVRGQTYENIEIIIVNDASTDNGIDIIRMHEKLDTRIKVIDLEFNTLGGAGIPSNIGVEHAKGKYIAYADSDDILDKYAIEKMIILAEKENLEVVIADFCNFSEEGREVKVAYDKEKWKGFPLEKAFSPIENPEIFRLSPVPWRKLYKRDFLIKYDIKFPEGDYFFEDNPLHWFTLSRAKRVALLDYVVAYHRMGREGQTMGSDSYKLSAMIQHLNTIKTYFIKNNINDKNLWKELLDLVYRTTWIIDKQSNDKIKRLIKKRFAITAFEIVRESKLSKNDILKIRKNFFTRFEEYYNSYEDKDLTIVIPAYNAEDFIKDTLKSVNNLGINYDVLIIDDGSSDNTLNIIKEYESEYIHIFSQKNRGAGVARNTLIPLIVGRYAYFLDADDEIIKENLIKALYQAINNNLDLLLFKYKIHFYEKNEYREMWNEDKKNWELIQTSKSLVDKKKFACKLINYPWNRLIKSSHLHNNNVFFGKTIVHNDIPYHWHSIIPANSISLFNGEVCIHKKFEKREQVTNINDKRRMAVLESLRHTFSVIRKYKEFNYVFNEWISFSVHLIKWAESRIPKEIQKEYNNKALNLLKNMKFFKLKKILKNNIYLIDNKVIDYNKDSFSTQELLYILLKSHLNEIEINNEIFNKLINVSKNKVLDKEILLKCQDKLEANTNQQLIKLFLIIDNQHFNINELDKVLINLNYLYDIFMERKSQNNLNLTNHVKLLISLIDNIKKELKK